MMKKIYTFLIALFFIGGTMGQGCLPDGITFDSQTSIDNFQTNYPGCTFIEGDVIINGNNITNLGGLIILDSILGNVDITYNQRLKNLTGLDNITSIGGFLGISANDSLSSLTGLENLSSIGSGFYIGWVAGWCFSNPILTDISSLSNLISIGGGLIICECNSLENLNGLGNTSIGDEYGQGTLWILSNASLSNISGIENVNENSISSLHIIENPFLSTCEVFSVCNYLAMSGADVYIENNDTGCNSQQEVEDACESVSIEELNSLNDAKIFPSPSSSTITIELPSKPSINTTLTLSSTNGQQLITQPITKPQTEIDISYLPNGIYIVKVWNDKHLMVRKVIKQ